MEEFFTKLKFEAVKDTKSFNDLKKSMNELGSGWSDNITKELRSIRQLQYELNELSSQFKLIENLKGEEFEKLRSELRDEIKKRQQQLDKKMLSEEQDVELGKKSSKEASKEFVTNMSNALVDISKKFLNELSERLSEAWAELGNITDFSRMSNANTRNLAFTYGFSSSQAYGYSEAMKMLGFQSEEDLMYATSSELTEFKRLFTKYSQWYEEYADDEMNIYRQFQLESAEFQKDLKLTVIEFFMNNKDTLAATIKIVFKAADKLISTLQWLSKYYGGETTTDSERAAEISDAIANWSYTTTNNNVNVNNVQNIHSTAPATEVGKEAAYALQAMYGG